MEGPVTLSFQLSPELTCIPPLYTHTHTHTHITHHTNTHTILYTYRYQKTKTALNEGGKKASEAVTSAGTKIK